MLEVPARGFEGGPGGASGLVAVVGWAVVAGGVGVSFAFGREVVFLVADHFWAVLSDVLV